jgi:hypothetical protein
VNLPSLGSSQCVRACMRASIALPIAIRRHAKTTVCNKPVQEMGSKVHGPRRGCSSEIATKCCTMKCCDRRASEVYFPIRLSCGERSTTGHQIKRSRESCTREERQASDDLTVGIQPPDTYHRSISAANSGQLQHRGLRGNHQLI